MRWRDGADNVLLVVRLWHSLQTVTHMGTKWNGLCVPFPFLN